MRTFPLDSSKLTAHDGASTKLASTHELPGTNIALIRPSPINPEVLSAPRPDDRILPTKVTDEDLKLNGEKKRETQTIAHAAPGVVIPIKKPGEVLHPDLKVPVAFSTASPSTEANKELVEKTVDAQSKRDVENKRQSESHSHTQLVDDHKQTAENAHLKSGHHSMNEPTRTHDVEAPKLSFSHPRHEEKRPRRDPPKRQTRHTDNDNTAAPRDSPKPETVASTQLLPVESGHDEHSSILPQKLHSFPSIQQNKREAEETISIENESNEDEQSAPHSEYHDSKHSPAFIHPVPVSQIIKNSAAAPVSHA